MNLEELLTKYFEGETSAAEEEQLRTHFAAGKVPPEYEVYRPLFAYFNQEIASEKEKGKEQKEVTLPTITRKQHRVHGMLYILSGVAASFLLLLGLNYWFNPTSTRFCSGNYVVINGRCYTDMHTVRKMAFDALQDVAEPASNYLPKTEEAEDNEIIKNQLKELGSLFSEDD